VLPLFYGALLIGAFMLVRDIAGRSLASRASTRLRRRVALVAAAGPGIAPIIYFGTGSNGAAAALSVLGVGYLLFYVLFGLGVLELIPSPAARFARRAGYAGLLVLGALPSWGLLYLAPFTGVASMGLVEEASAG
jgi:hypothetical protein